MQEHPSLCPNYRSPENGHEISPMTRFCHLINDFPEVRHWLLSHQPCWVNLGPLELANSFVAGLEIKQSHYDLSSYGPTKDEISTAISPKTQQLLCSYDSSKKLFMLNRMTDHFGFYTVFSGSELVPNSETKDSSFAAVRKLVVDYSLSSAWHSYQVAWASRSQFAVLCHVTAPTTHQTELVYFNLDLVFPEIARTQNSSFSSDDQEYSSSDNPVVEYDPSMSLEAISKSKGIVGKAYFKQISCEFCEMRKAECFCRDVPQRGLQQFQPHQPLHFWSQLFEARKHKPFKCSFRLELPNSAAIRTMIDVKYNPEPGRDSVVAFLQNQYFARHGKLTRSLQLSRPACPLHDTTDEEQTDCLRCHMVHWWDRMGKMLQPVENSKSLEYIASSCEVSENHDNLHLSRDMLNNLEKEISIEILEKSDHEGVQLGLVSSVSTDKRESIGTESSEHYRATGTYRHVESPSSSIDNSQNKISDKNKNTQKPLDSSNVRNRKVKCVCNYCDAVFTQQWHLDQHISAVHEKLRPFACDLCSRSFGRNSDLLKHKRVVHLKLRRFKCDCGAKFCQSSDLRRHQMRFHNEMKS